MKKCKNCTWFHDHSCHGLPVSKIKNTHKGTCQVVADRPTRGGDTCDKWEKMQPQGQIAITFNPY